MKVVLRIFFYDNNDLKCCYFVFLSIISNNKFRDDLEIGIVVSLLNFLIKS